METNEIDKSKSIKPGKSTLANPLATKKPRSKLKFALKLSAIALIAIAIGLGGYFGVSAYRQLQDENTNLNDELSKWEDQYTDRLVEIEMSDEDMRNRLLRECEGEIIDEVWQETCEKLKNGTDEEIQQILEQYSYGTLRQSNVALDDDHKPTNRYVGGKYAPYWILHGLNVSLPDGIIMERTINFWTDGVLGQYNDEGIFGCDGSGISMSVASDIHSRSKTFVAHAYAQSYTSVPGCMGGYFLYVAHADYKKLPNYPDKTFMEIATYECKDMENYDDAAKKTCANGKYDTKSWTLFAGIVSSADIEFDPIRVGTVVSDYDIIKSTIVNDATNFSFDIYCQGDQWYANIGSSTACGSSFSDYKKVLAHSEYKELKDIIFSLQKN